MKLLFVIQRYGLEVDGGAELYCRWLAEHCSVDHEITVLTTTARDYVTWANHYSAGEEQINGIQVVRCRVDAERDIDSFNRHTERLLNGQSTRREEVRWIREQGPVSQELLRYIHTYQSSFDAIVFFTYLYAPTVFGCSIAPEKSILVSTAHDEPVAHLNIIRKLYSTVAGLLFLTPDEQHFVKTTYDVANTPAMLLGTGVDIPDTQRTVQEITERYSLSGQVVLYIGRVESGKGCDSLIRGFLNTRQESPYPLTLVLAGRIHMDIKDDPDIRTPGFIPDCDIEPLLDAADIIVVPSAYESLSILLLQAFKRGKPVIVNGQSPVLKGHCLASNGGLYYQSDQEFEAALALLLERQDLRLKLGQNGRDYVQKTYQWSKVRDRFSQFVNRIG